MNYSVAIRTLGTNPEMLKLELESVFNQTIQPEKVIIYIAEGYSRPTYQVSTEEYVWVKKGMVAQRALKYREIDSELLLLMDDDVELACDSVEKMLSALKEHDADCIGADVFETYKLPLKSKVYAALTNWVFPHFDKSSADKVRLTGSFTYNNCPKEPVLPTQCVGGPCSLWKKKIINVLNWEVELWMDRLANFPYGEDMVQSYKLHINGGKMFMIFNANIKNLNGQSSSSNYHANHRKFYIRSLMMFCNWWRIIYETRPNVSARIKSICAFSAKLIWLMIINAVAACVMLNIKILVYYFKGIRDGWRYVHSNDYLSLPPYLINK